MCAKRTSTSKKRARSPEAVQKTSKAQVVKNVALNDEHASKRVKVAEAITSTKVPKETNSKIKAQTPVETIAVEPEPETEPAEVAELPATVKANLTGKFDLYATTLPFLNKVYKPEGDSTFHAEELYHTILKYQAKGDKTATVYMTDDSSDGIFKLSLKRGACDKFRDERLQEQIVVRNFDVIEEEEQTYEYDKEYPRPEDAWSGKGLATIIGLKEEICYGPRSSGELELRPLWKKEENGKVMELFEGLFYLDVKYQRQFYKHKRSRHEPDPEPDVNIETAIWAVRSISNVEDEEVESDADSDEECWEDNEY